MRLSTPSSRTFRGKERQALTTWSPKRNGPTNDARDRMTSPQRLRANRANSRRSPGPKTQAGRTKSAHNARRHGLRVPVLSERALADEVEHLAQKIIDG